MVPIGLAWVAITASAAPSPAEPSAAPPEAAPEAAPAAAQAPNRLADPVRPASQRVALALDPAKDAVTGTTTIRIVVGAPIARFSLHAEQLDVTSATLRRADKDKRKPKPASITRASPSLVTIEAGKTLAPGPYDLELAFTGAIRSQTYGLYRFEVDGVPYIASQFEADEARTAWPCFDEPRFKVALQLAVTAPMGDQVISNAPVVNTSDPVDGKVTTVFAETKPQPTYATALLVGPYVRTEVPGVDVPTAVWTVKGHEAYATGLVRDLPGATRALEDWFGSPVPYPKNDWVVVPEFTYGAMENPGAVVASEQYVPPVDRATADEAEYAVHIVAHEQAHFWFGDMVTMAWWDDLWLNESFAEWLGRKVTAELHPEFRGDIGRVERLADMLALDAQDSVRPLRVEVDPTAVFETANFQVYSKGEALLDMVEGWIGPDAFQQGLRSYLERHAWGNAAAADLFQALSEASGEDVAQVMGAYLDTPGAPWLAFTRAADGGLLVNQRPFGLPGAAAPAGGPWTVPVRMRVGRPDGRVDVVTVTVAPGSASSPAPVDLGGPFTWYHPSADGIGYYGWTMPEADLDALVAAAPTLQASERAVILSMLGLQHRGGERTVGQVAERARAFAADPDPLVLSAAIGAILEVKRAELLGDPALTESARGYVRARLQPPLDALGPAPGRGVDGVGEAPDRARLRRLLLTALAWAKAPTVVALGTELGNRAMLDLGAVEPELAAFGLRTLAENTPDPAGLQKRLMLLADAQTDPNARQAYLAAFGQVHGDAALEAALVWAFDPHTSVSDMNAVVLGGVLTRGLESERDRVLALTMEHYDALVTKLPPPIRAYVAFNAGGCSAERLEKGAAFFTDPARNPPGTDQILGTVGSEVHACVAALDRDGPALRALLADAAVPAANAANPKSKRVR